MAANGKAVMENVRRYRAIASGKLQASVPFRGHCGLRMTLSIYLKCRARTTDLTAPFCPQ